MADQWQDFRRVQSEWKVKQQEVKRKEAKDVKDKLQWGFDQIPPGCHFRSRLPDLSHVTVIRPQVKDAQSVHVVLFYRGARGSEEHATVSLMKDGTIRGKLPPELKKISKEDIAAELVANLEQINPQFWSEITTPIIPPGEIFPLGPREERGGGGPDDGPLVDPARLEHIMKQGALFGGLDKSGLSGYHVFVFENFFVLENERIDNAVYIVDIPNGIVVPGKATALNQTERDAFFAESEIVEVLGRTKQEMIADKVRTRRIVHQGEWMKRIDEIIANLRAEYLKKAQ